MRFVAFRRRCSVGRIRRRKRPEKTARRTALLFPDGAAGIFGEAKGTDFFRKGATPGRDLSTIYEKRSGRRSAQSGGKSGGRTVSETRPGGHSVRFVRFARRAGQKLFRFGATATAGRIPFDRS